MTKWAFCVDNVTAAKVFALVNLVLSVISMIISILKKAEEKEAAGDSGDDLTEVWEGTKRMFFILGAVVSIIDDIILVIGALKRNRVLLIVWMVIASILTAVACITLLWDVAYEKGLYMEEYLIQMANIFVNIWTLLIVSGAIKQIREE